MYIQQQIQQSFQENLKSHQQHFPRWQAMPRQPFLRAFQVHPPAYLTIFSFFHGGPPAPLLPPPKTPVMARTIIEIVMDRAVSIAAIVTPCSQNNVRILSANDVPLSRIFFKGLLDSCDLYLKVFPIP